PFHDAGGHRGELRHLRRQQHPGRPAAHDQHIDLLRHLLGTVDSRTCRLEDPWVVGDVSVVVELHRCRVLPRTTPSRPLLLCSIIELTVRLLMWIVYGAHVPCKRRRCVPCTRRRCVPCTRRRCVPCTRRRAPEVRGGSIGGVCR